MILDSHAVVLQGNITDDLGECSLNNSLKLLYKRHIISYIYYTIDSVVVSSDNGFTIVTIDSLYSTKLLRLIKDFGIPQYGI